MNIKTLKGEHEIDFLNPAEIVITSPREISIEIFENKEKDPKVLFSVNGLLKTRVLNPCTIIFPMAESTTWNLEVYEYLETDPADPVPNQMAVELKPPRTMEQKMRLFLSEIVAEKYGDNSEEMETFEEATNFDLPDNGVLPDETEFQKMPEEILDDSEDISEDTSENLTAPQEAEEPERQEEQKQ